MLVTNISTNTLTVVRGYAGTTPENLADNLVINILGNAALEGADMPTARFTSRSRCGNYTQIFTKTVEVSGTDMARASWAWRTRWTIRSRSVCARCCATWRTP